MFERFCCLLVRFCAWQPLGLCSIDLHACFTSVSSPWWCAPPATVCAVHGKLLRVCVCIHLPTVVIDPKVGPHPWIGRYISTSWCLHHDCMGPLRHITCELIGTCLRMRSTENLSICKCWFRGALSSRAMSQACSFMHGYTCMHVCVHVYVCDCRSYS